MCKNLRLWDGDASTDNIGLQPEVALLKCETKKGPRFFLDFLRICNGSKKLSSSYSKNMKMLIYQAF